MERQCGGNSGELKAEKMNERYTVAICNLKTNYRSREITGTYKAEVLVRQF
jgi:hypothetical protein